MRVAIVGGGPAGMMAAYAALSQGDDVTLFERNEKLGKKLYLTGKGRCNITNNRDISEFQRNIPTNPKFLYSAFNTFSNVELIALLESVGLKTVVERGGRIFPSSGHSSDVIRALRTLIKGANVRLNSKVERVIAEDDVVKGIVVGGREEHFDKVILATGGISYPATGSTGDGHNFARATGHIVTELQPSLVPLHVLERDICCKMAGVALKNIELRLIQRGKEVFKDMGEMLFTHQGVSGPLVLTASALLDGVDEAILRIDTKPGISNEELDERFIRELSEAKGKQLKNALCSFYPRKMAETMPDIAQIDGEKRADSLTREERLRLLNATKSFTLSIKGYGGMDEAVITRGGVRVEQINPSTMQSRHVKGLYFAGELIDVDAYTGGYNLQIAFSTGYLAGLS